MVCYFGGMASEVWGNGIGVVGGQWRGGDDAGTGSVVGWGKVVCFSCFVAAGPMSL